MKNLILFIFLCIYATDGFCQEIKMSLWSDKIPNSIISDQDEIIQQRGIQWITKVTQPTLEVYLPSSNNRTGTAVVICPGGGYSGLAYDWEGSDIAKWLNGNGIVAIVLKYRLPDSLLQKNPHLAPLQDAQRALRTVRFHAKEWEIDAGKIGLMGFSAGGHLAASLGTHFEDHLYEPITNMDSVSARPDFLALIYPVISMQKMITHGGSKQNLLGKNPDPKLVNYFSNEINVNTHTPPTFIIHSGDDLAVPVENSLTLYRALLQMKIPVEMHLFREGGHGYSLGIGNDHLQYWNTLFISWLNKYF